LNSSVDAVEGAGEGEIMPEGGVGGLDRDTADAMEAVEEEEGLGPSKLDVDVDVTASTIPVMPIPMLVPIPTSPPPAATPCNGAAAALDAATEFDIE
jgi:hypothetical protein